MNDALNQALTLIQSHYGSRKAKRSRVPLMNHIVEGLDIIELETCLGIQPLTPQETTL